jgi:hypothetical protein
MGDDTPARSLAKFGLPPLSARRQRRLKIMIDKLQEQHGFIDGANLSWSDDYFRRQRMASRFITSDLFDVIDARPITADEYQTVIARHQNEPQVVKQIGVDETVALWIGMFDAYVEIHFEEWAQARKPYEEFSARLLLIRSRVTEDCRAKWPGHAEWFDLVCLPRANAVGEIETRIDLWRTRARDLEEERLAEAETKTARGARRRKRSNQPAKPAPQPQPARDVPAPGGSPAEPEGVQPKGRRGRYLSDDPATTKIIARYEKRRAKLKHKPEISEVLDAYSKENPEMPPKERKRLDSALRRHEARSHPKPRKS